jgi:alpha-L-arabinofuranosidase
VPWGGKGEHIVVTPRGPFCASADSDGFSQNAPNVDEYIALCRAVNATPAITVALQFGSPQEIQDAVDLLEYTNGNASTPWGALRVSRGFPEPYDVRIWYLGNEINMQARYADYPSNVNGVGPPTATEYASMLAVLVPAMRNVDPTVMLSVVEGGSAWDGEWATDANVGPYVSLTSFHGGYCSSNGPLFPQDFTSEVLLRDV